MMIPEDQPSRNPLVDIRFLYLVTQSIRVSDYNDNHDDTVTPQPRPLYTEDRLPFEFTVWFPSPLRDSSPFGSELLLLAAPGRGMRLQGSICNRAFFIAVLLGDIA